MVFFPEGGTKQSQRVLPRRQVLREIEAAGAAQSAAAEPCHQCAFLCLELRTNFRQVLLDGLECQWRQPQVHAARSDRGQQRRRVIGEQKDRREVGRLFENLQQRICGLLHEVGFAEDIDPPVSFRRAIVDFVDDVPHLVHLHQHLRRIGRNDRDIRMGLHEDACLALVRVAQVLPRLHRLGETLFESIGLRDARAVRAHPAKVR